MGSVLGPLFFLQLKWYKLFADDTPLGDFEPVLPKNCLLEENEQEKIMKIKH